MEKRTRIKIQDMEANAAGDLSDDDVRKITGGFSDPGDAVPGDPLRTARREGRVAATGYSLDIGGKVTGY